MEITYDLIIKYLVNKNTNENLINVFTTQKNIYTYSSSWPEKFKQIFTDKFYRYGVTIYDSDNNNISFWSSLITLLFNEFIISYTDDEISIINNFKFQILEKYKVSKLSNFIKKLDKNDFRERFKLIPDNNVLQYIVDILDINLLIFDFKENVISSVYSGDIMNPWKQILLLSKHNELWEPIMLLNSKGEIQRLFDYNNIIIKKLLYTKDLIIYNSSDKIFNITSEINDIIAIEDYKINNNESNKIKYDIKKLNKLKLDELLKLSKEFDIILDKKPTKAILINLIHEKIK